MTENVTDLHDMFAVALATPLYAVPFVHQRVFVPFVLELEIGQRG